MRHKVETGKFWEGIWGTGVMHNASAKWLSRLREKQRKVIQQDMVIQQNMVTIGVDELKKRVQRMKN